jgi:AcrR family transcriptional regulator
MGNGTHTKTSILDAAERLFADSGYDIVSMREVAQTAAVPLGLINYHFGTKDNLFEAVIARRANELNARRRAALSALGGTNPGIEQILGAHLRPYLELMLQGGPGWRSYGRLVAQTAQSDRWCELITRHFDEIARLFMEALVAAEPRLSQEAVTRGYVHMVSVMVGVFVATQQLDLLSGGTYTSQDLERAYQFMLPFLAGGFRGSFANAAAGEEVNGQGPIIGEHRRLSAASRRRNRPAAIRGIKGRTG